ncbi:3-dehydroquinate synthase [bacterium]|nr:3-dehydroquinate synthase [bacterium]
MRSLRLDLGERSYPIHIGRALPPGLLTDALAGRPAVALVDSEVARLQAPALARLLGGLPRLIVPSGEASKSLARREALARERLALGLGRDGALVAVGGGVCGDLCGFLAACYLRGIPFVQVPTTLLAQADASVGGKVAVNLPGAKNSLGAFHQPVAVLADLDFLGSLPRRELSAGLAEIAKIAAVRDRDLLAELERGGVALLAADAPALVGILGRACALKAEVVADDEREAGRRAILNFGHTIGHGLEGLSPRPDLLHGEAVAIGMLAALRLGAALGLAGRAEEQRLAALLRAWKLPLRPPAPVAIDSLLAAMGSDKKRRRGALRFVLLEGWGQPRRDVELPGPLLAQTLAAFLADAE